MPELSRFFGIIITMYREVGGRHHCPHIHAKYGSLKAVFYIETSAQMEGFFSPKERKLVEAWIEIHKDELRRNWEKLNIPSGTVSFNKIEPLK